MQSSTAHPAEPSRDSESSGKVKKELTRNRAAEAALFQRLAAPAPLTMSFQKLLPWIGILLLPAIFYLALAGEGSNE